MYILDKICKGGKKCLDFYCFTALLKYKIIGNLKILAQCVGRSLFNNYRQYITIQ